MQDHLKMDTKLSNPITLQQILRKFPRITSFEFFQRDLFLSQLRTLLNAWREDLSHLKIVLFSRKYEPNLDGLNEDEWRQLIIGLKGWLIECVILVVVDFAIKNGLKD